MVKIMFNEKKIFGVEKYEDCVYPCNINSAMIVFGLNGEKVRRGLDVLLVSEIENLIFITGDGELINLLKMIFPTVIAGGGVVQNARGAYLFIFRRNKWDLPKGKVEVGESIEDCAQREVKEETGLINLELLSFVGQTWHFYLEKDLVFKETHWYLMYSDDSELHPQLGEGITKVEWVPSNKLLTPLRKSYESIRDLFTLMGKFKP